MADPNLLYYGDNLDVPDVGDETIDLVYPDPPFNSNASYNGLFAEHGTHSAAQTRAFEDTTNRPFTPARSHVDALVA